MRFICPKCKGQLNIIGASAVCSAGHSYDKSRYGYYNLLLSASGGVHGDNREMVAARSDFLDTDAYLPLAERVAATAAELTPDCGVVLDIGSGEGYYTRRVSDAMCDAGKNADILGFDISKEAVKRAARRVPGATFAVATAYAMPIADSSVDVALNIFSPLAREEVVRVLKRGGKFIMAIPDTYHLFGLKSVLYEKPYLNEVADTALEGLKLIRTEKIAYTLELSGAERINSLFMMTPYAYRTPKSARERLLSLDKLTTEVSFILLVYEKV